jgi:hypothetical protein
LMGGWMGEWMGGWVGGWMGRRTDGWVAGKGTEKPRSGCLNIVLRLEVSNSKIRTC